MPHAALWTSATLVSVIANGQYDRGKNLGDPQVAGRNQHHFAGDTECAKSSSPQSP
jgi:hypothetical protein